MKIAMIKTDVEKRKYNSVSSLGVCTEVNYLPKGLQRDIVSTQRLEGFARQCAVVRQKHKSEGRS